MNCFSFASGARLCIKMLTCCKYQLAHHRPQSSSSFNLQVLADSIVNKILANQQKYGLIVNLLAKSYGWPSELNEDKMEKIKENQKLLVEATDMIYVARLLHRGIVDVPNSKSVNRVPILVGDYLLAKASKILAQVRNPAIVSYMALPIRHFTEAEFLKCERRKNVNDFQLINKFCFLSGGSLLAHSCQVILKLADFDEKQQSDAFRIGKHLGIAIEIQELKENAIDLVFDDKKVEDDLIKDVFELNVEDALILVKNLLPSEAGQRILEFVSNLRTTEESKNLNNIISSFCNMNNN